MTSFRDDLSKEVQLQQNLPWQFPGMSCGQDGSQITVGQVMDIVRVDALARRKNPKRHFFRDIQNSFHEVTHVGLEPHQIFSF